MLVGRFYNRLGLARAAMVAPVNFLAVFGGLAAWFHMAVAAYGQFSIILIQRTVAGPISKVLFNLVPKSERRWSRVFVRATVVKIGMMLGALLVFSLKPVLEPHYLAPVGMVIALLWAVETLRFRRQYQRGLKQVISEEQIDYDRMDMGGIVHTEAVSADTRTNAPTQAEGTAGADEPMAGGREEALKLLHDEDEIVRARAVAYFAQHKDPAAGSRIVDLLDDSERVRRAAMEALIGYADLLAPYLETRIPAMSPRAQRSLLEALRISGHKGFDVLPFAGRLLAEGYWLLVAIEQVQCLPAASTRDMLVAHLQERTREVIGLVFQALWVNQADMRLMYTALCSREAAAAVELVESTVDRSLTKYLVPMIEDIPVAEKIKQGRALFPLVQNEKPQRILMQLAASEDATTRMLAAHAMGQTGGAAGFIPALVSLGRDPDPHVRQTAGHALQACLGKENKMPEIVDHMNRLKDFILFDEMGVRELQAIAAISVKQTYTAGEIILNEGEDYGFLYLVVKGRVESWCAYGEAEEKLQKGFGPGAFLGELSLFTDLSANVTYVAAGPLEVLTIRKEHFNEIMKIYPQIAINLCLFFSLRLVAFQAETYQVC